MCVASFLSFGSVADASPLTSAMMDSRIIDVNFSRTFMRLVLEQDLPLSVASVKVCAGRLSAYMILTH